MSLASQAWLSVKYCSYLSWQIPSQIFFKKRSALCSLQKQWANWYPEFLPNTRGYFILLYNSLMHIPKRKVWFTAISSMSGCQYHKVVENFKTERDPNGTVFLIMNWVFWTRTSLNILPAVQVYDYVSMICVYGCTHIHIKRGHKVSSWIFFFSKHSKMYMWPIFWRKQFQQIVNMKAVLILSTTP